ncbi:MAG TPA: SurA N-terminal domain-containing protein [Candidatus Hydrogenedentes bacterium]|nr:SurA N-terminal domain-containing protein [Candidatus Hydrogenedentota bacterium]HOV75374.1 SurA N-terminal domain-containing protein [Candidatus Hydrogenedentota bacterium]HPC15618.1 SurA N-terminal domain-containing protein [Candidatus Hydrogenedentota bacterium]HRT19438.1 SurA N-terminal domain-containing protein [Candidatus Hydrogenedentota bacterium]HRT63828.1 SurA N-terminal domain-containing protein [Candidatus Hydrogenedentota bacterium]
MVHLMRKYKKSILTVLIVLIIGPFVVWGGYAGRSRRGMHRGDGQTSGVVATVGKSPILAMDFERRMNAELDRRAQGGPRPPVSELAKDGTAERVLDSLIDSALLTMEVQKTDFAMDKAMLLERLKKEPAFQDEKGNFSPSLWNAWIDSERGRNWNVIYDELRAQAGRELLVRQAMAPARVLDTEIRKQFEDNHTKIQIRYVKVDPEIVPTEEQIKAEYDKDPTRYQLPEKRDIEFAAVSLAVERPALLDDLVKRAREGADFAELAKQHSEGPDKEQGGEMEWVAPGPNDPDHIKALLGLPVGAVSDPIESFGAYYIFKVEQERTDEATGARSVKAREIIIRPKLTEGERMAREEKAAHLLAKAKESGDLRTAAAEAGLPVMTAQGISRDSESIENVAKEDLWAVRSGLANVALNEFPKEVIKGRANLYVAKVIQIEPPVLQPLEAVREKVVKDAIETIRQSPERADELAKLGEKLAADAHSLQDVVAKAPELNLEIKESKEFTRRDFLFSDQIYVQTVEVYDVLGQKEPGAFAGPLKGFRSDLYFVELLKKTPPDEKAWQEEWPKEEEQLRKGALSAKRAQILSDYLADLRERRGREIAITRNYDEINRMLGIGREEEENAENTEAPPLQHVPMGDLPKPNLGPAASE